MGATKASVLATLALLSGSLLVVNAAPAQAAYPGDNGRIVIVGDDGNGTWDVITMDADGTDRVNLTQGAFDAELPVWSPDGTRIAFSSTMGSPSGCRTGDIYVMNADGSDMTSLTTNEFGVAAYDPTWSPDGSEIAFTREHADSTCTSGDIDIWKMSSDGSGQVLLTSGGNAFGPAYDAEPAWSPDGDRIAFRSDRANADWADSDQIYTMDPDGSNITQVTHLEPSTFEANLKPAWSPDGQQIAFERHQQFPDPPSGQASSQIWRINEDGAGETAVTANGFTANMDPAWSPDGQRILFANQFEKPTGFDNDIYAINPDGTDQVNVTNTDSPEVHPDWQPVAEPTSPGATGKLAFVAPGPSGTFDIWTMNPDGTDMTAITNLGQDIGYVAWSPDGTELAFSTGTTSPSGCSFGEVYVVNADGSGLTQLTSTPDVIESDPTWSPDGTRIAYVATTQDAACSPGQRGLWIMNADGSGRTALTAPPDGKFDTEPAWSPTGSTIAFTSNRPGPSGSGKPDIWLVQADGSGLTQLTDSVGTFFRSLSPTWSPDGQRVAFERPNSFSGGSNIWFVGADGTGMTQVTNQSFFTFQPDWSPDGEQIVYLGQDTCCDGLDLWVVDIDTAAMTQLTDGFAVARPDWQPLVAPDPVQDGKIAWVSAGPDGSFTNDIWTMDPDGSNKTNLLPGDFSEAYPEWSRDGTKIAFSRSGSLPNGCQFGDIFVMDADGSNVTPVTTNPPGVAAFDPTWSPDGQRIAFTRVQHDPDTCSGGDGGIWVTDVDGTNQAALTTGGTDEEPAWSPDGTKIAFAGSRPDENGDRFVEIYTMDPDGSNVTKLTDTEFLDPEFNENPVWSPDGTKIAFDHIFWLSTNYEIWTMNADGSNEIPVTQNGFAANNDPTWSPDGTRIAFSATDVVGSYSEIYTIGADGSDQQQITDNDVNDFTPTWQPLVRPPAVAPPTFTGTDPVSPANDNNPRIIGTAAGAHTVTLYETADCSGAAAVQGPAADFASPGLQVAVLDDSTTTFYGTATDSDANTSACSSSSITYVETSAPADLVVTDCADPALADVTSIEGDLIVEDLATCESLSLPALTDAGGVDLTGNSALEVVNLTSLTTVSGDVTITDNGSVAVNLTSLTTVSGDVTITGNDAATVDLTSLTTVSGDITITDNGSATLNLADGGTVAGNVTIEGQGAGEVNLPAASGDMTIDTSGYDVIGGVTADGTTSISNTDGQAVMRVVLPEGTFETPVAFTITMLEPATLVPEGGTGADGVAATIDPLAAYSFEFAVPVLGLDATLSFDVFLDSLDADAQAALLAALDAGTATLVTKGGEAGDTYQAFPLCSAGAVPAADGCILVEHLDADGQTTADPPAIVRFTGVTGHFSTWGVAIVEPLPAPDTTPPVVAPHGDVTVEASGPTGATVTYTQPTATDDLDGPVAVVCLPATGSVFPLGTTAVGCSAEDAAGNLVMSTFDVIVSDTTAPTIDVPADITVPATAPSGTAVSFTATATDAVDGVTPANCAPPSGSVFPVGVTPVVCTATDAAGNAATPAGFEVTVLDPRAELEDLLHDVEASSIQQGLRLDLTKKLEAALKALTKSPPDAVLACEKLDEFARKVELEASRRPAKIPAPTAAAWLAATADIRSGLGC